MYIENKQIKKYISVWLVSMFWIISLIIIVGGLTRLTDSGLSITQWQLFTGIFPPLNDFEWNNYFNLYKEIPEYKIQNHKMTINEFKYIFWWEWIHRILGRIAGITYLIPLIYFSSKIGFKYLKGLYLIFFLICFQGFIGWYMVSSGLTYRIDVSHFRLSFHLNVAFIILSLIIWNYLKINNIKKSDKTLNNFYPIIFLILIFIQITIGAFVAGMDAGKIYNSWPLMGNNYFPDDSNFTNLFKFQVFNDPSLIQFIHRNLAYLIFFYYLYILYQIFKYELAKLLNIIKLIGLFLTLQIILGIFTLLFDAQIVFSSMHQITSIFLVSSSIYFLYLNNSTIQQPSN